MPSRISSRRSVDIEQCPVFIAARILGKKWAILILQEMMMPEAEDGLRFSEIQRHLDWITPKVLSKRLKELVSEGILNRHVDSSVIPPRVTYTLTDKGLALKEIIVLMQQWGKKHGGDAASACYGMDFTHCRICRRYS